MSEFGIRDIDLTRIESRPLNRTRHLRLLPWTAWAHRRQRGGRALKALHRRCADVRYLGSWPTGAATGSVPPATRRGRAVADAAAPGCGVSGQLILVRHGQSVANVERRLDTRPPAPISPSSASSRLVRSRGQPHPPGLLLHSGSPVARSDRRAIGSETGRSPKGSRGAFTRCIAGDLENRNDDEASPSSTSCTSAGMRAT